MRKANATTCSLQIWCIRSASTNRFEVQKGNNWQHREVGEFIFQASWSKHSATVELSWEKWNCFTNLSLLQRLNDAVTSCSSSANTCTQANTVDLPESKNHVVSYPGIEVHWEVMDLLVLLKTKAIADSFQLQWMCTWRFGTKHSTYDLDYNDPENCI